MISKVKAIKRLVDKNLSPREVVVRLGEKFSTITLVEVHLERARLERARPSDTFTGPGTGD